MTQVMYWKKSEVYTDEINSLEWFLGTITADGNPLRGFLVQAWDPSGTRIGVFTAGAGQKFMDCSQMYSSIPESVRIL